MDKEYIMVIDEGTTSLRSVIFDRNMKPVCQARRSIEMICPGEGEVEQSPVEIYEKTVDSMREALKEGGIVAGQIAAIGITNQRGTWTLWDKRTGMPYTNFITWMDTRSEKSKPYFSIHEEFNRLFPDQMDMMPPWNFVLGFQQMCENRPELLDIVKDKNTLFGTVDTWIIWKLTGGRSFKISSSSDHSGPFYVLGAMDEKYKSAQLFGMHEDIFPQVMEEADEYGLLDLDILGEEIPILGNIADQQSSLFSQGCIRSGDAKCTCGTGAFVNVNIENMFLTNHEVTSYIAWSVDGKKVNCVEGVAGNAGTCLEWAKNQIGLFEEFSEIEGIAGKVSDNDGVYFVPALAGMECANYLLPSAKGAFLGLTVRTKKEHLVRAVMEAIAFAIANVFRRLENLGFRTGRIFIDGGVSKSDLICQKLANVTGLRVIRSENVESTAMGAAEMAAIRLGWMKQEDVLTFAKDEKEFRPDGKADADRAEFEQWEAYVKMVCGYYG